MKPKPRAGKGPPASVLAEPRKRWWTRITRDLILFTVGVLLVVNEAVIRAGPPRESLLVLYGGMIGLPAILRADQIRRNGGDK